MNYDFTDKILCETDPEEIRRLVAARDEMMRTWTREQLIAGAIEPLSDRERQAAATLIAELEKAQMRRKR